MKKILTAGLVLGIAVLLGACGSLGSQNGTDTKPERDSTQSGENVSQPGFDTVTEPVIEDTGFYSYITGLPVKEGDQNNRPVAVMLNNIKAGCPQAGINEASVIYEAPVEGRITRLMGIFENYENMDKIGYIRSSRDYYVYCALEFDAVYAHFGQATPYVGELLNSNRVDNISGAVAGINKPAEYSFKLDPNRKPPHHIYLTGEGIMKDMDRFGYSRTYHDTHSRKFTFRSASDRNLYADAPEVTGIYPGGKSKDKVNGYSRVQANFQYNKKDSKYYRYQYGAEQVDELTGAQIAVDNVILQYCYGEVRDSNDYLAFSCHSQNPMPVQVFTGGKIISGTWTRDGDNDPALYTDEEGNPIRLAPGKTWICLVWIDYTKDVELN